MIKKIIKNIYYYIIPIFIAFFNILIILKPSLVISSSKNGLLLWFNNVLPALLPFIIGTNLLIRLGFIDFLGNLLAPIMQKLFNVSGVGAFPLVLGMFSGYPIGAKIVSDLRINKKISKEEGERLLTFTNNSGPLFILGTVGIGMFKSVEIGYLMIFIHYISAITTGILFRNYKYQKNQIAINSINVKEAFKSLKSTRENDNKSFGEILSESVKNALEVTVVVGGFIILFSVISELFKHSNIFSYIGKLLLPKSLQNLSNGLFIGIIEMTNGCNILSLIRNEFSVMLAVGLISWSGFSIFAQTISFLNKTDLNISVYFLAKIIHSLISILYSILCFPLITNFLNSSVETTFKENFLNLTPLSIFNFSLNTIVFIFISLVILYFINLIFKLKKFL